MTRLELWNTLAGEGDCHESDNVTWWSASNQQDRSNKQTRQERGEIYNILMEKLDSYWSSERRAGEVVGWFIIQFIPNFPHNLSASKFSKISTKTSSNMQPEVAVE